MIHIKYKTLRTWILFFAFAVLVILITSVMFFFNNNNSTALKRLSAQKGVLDLTDWDFEKDGTVALNGEWEFYWNQLLTYEDFHKEDGDIRPSAYVLVPDVWNKYTVDEKRLPGEGYATYRLKIKTQDTAMKGLKILNLSNAYKLMIDSEQIAANGIVGKNEKEAVPEYKPQARVFKNNAGDFEVIVQISNYTYARGGLWNPIYLGTDRQITDMKENASRRELFIFGGIMMMLFYQASIFFFLRKNTMILYYILALLTLAVRIPVTGEYLISSIFPRTGFGLLVLLEYLTIYWPVILWLLFLSGLYPEEFPKRAVKVVLGAGTLLAVFTLAVPIRVYSRYLLLYIFFVIVLYVYILVQISTAVIRKRQGAALMSLGTICFIVTFLCDALYQWNAIKGDSRGISVFIITFTQAYMLAAYFSAESKKVEVLSQSIRQTEMSFLRAQIKPHFLYNAINAILYTLRRDVQKGCELLSSLSIFLRGSFDFENRDILIPFHSELQTVEAYIHIEKARFGDRLQIEYSITCEDFSIPPLVLQPLVENAIRHGVMGKREGGTVKIRAYRENKNIILQVSDDGVGIPSEKLGDYLSLKSGKGIGLPNINARLMKHYGQPLVIESTPDRGTCITIKIPVEE